MYAITYAMRDVDCGNATTPGYLFHRLYVKNVKLDNNAVRRRTDAEPQAFMPTVPPNAVHLPFLREAPHLIHLVSDFRTTDFAHAVARISISPKSMRYASGGVHW